MNLKKYTTDSYIKECNIIHNNKYDYSLVEYEFSMSKIRIICREHGEFEQNTIDRENILKKNGYKFVTIWESDFKKMK